MDTDLLQPLREVIDLLRNVAVQPGEWLHAGGGWFIWGLLRLHPIDIYIQPSEQPDM